MAGGQAGPAPNGLGKQRNVSSCFTLIHVFFLEKGMRKREECRRREARALAEEEILRSHCEGHVGYRTILAKV